MLLPGKTRAGSADLFYERRLMSAADERCRLFPPDLAHALEAAALQARGAALRAGASDADLNALAARARAKADATPCGSKDLATAAARVLQAFKGYAALRTLNFPGPTRGWFADREALLLADRRPPRFVLIQRFQIDGHEAAAGYVSGLGFGVAVKGEAPSAFAAARIMIRDPRLSPKPALQAGVSPPALTSFLARDIRAAPPGLLEAGDAPCALFLFGEAAADALGALDPREFARVELIRPIRGGERALTGAVEAGDFAAARAFLAVGRR